MLAAVPILDLAPLAARHAAVIVCVAVAVYLATRWLGGLLPSGRARQRFLRAGLLVILAGWALELSGVPGLLAEFTSPRRTSQVRAGGGRSAESAATEARPLAEDGSGSFPLSPGTGQPALGPNARADHPPVDLSREAGNSPWRVDLPLGAGDQISAPQAAAQPSHRRLRNEASEAGSGPLASPVGPPIDAPFSATVTGLPEDRHSDNMLTSPQTGALLAAKLALLAVLAAWLVGTACHLMRLALAHKALQRLVRAQRVGQDAAAGGAALAAASSMLAQLQTQLNVRRPVRLIVMREIPGPIAFGVWFPTIAIPAVNWEQLPGKQRRAILAHELAHLAARDPFWNLLAELMVAACWWLPPMRWLRNDHRAASERAADEASLFLPDGPADLAEGLVRLAGWIAAGGRRIASDGAAFTAVGQSSPSSLATRIGRLLALADEGRGRERPRVLAILRAALFSLMLLAVGFPQIGLSQTVSHSQERYVMTLPQLWKHSLAATALWLAVSPLTADENPEQERVERQRQEQRERDERERGERERGERERDERERGERERGERERDERERDERERGERERNEPERGEWERLEERARRARVDATRAQLLANHNELESQLKRLDPQSGDARFVRGKMAQIERELQQLNRREGPEAREGGDEIERRRRHLAAAIDNLRAAGLAEQAARLEREAGELLRRGPRRPGSPQPHGVYPGRPAPPHDQINELRAQVRELREQMQVVLRVLRETRGEDRDKARRGDDDDDDDDDGDDDDDDE